MESLTYLKNVRISPKKLRFMVAPVKKMKPAAALDYLMYMPQKTANICYKAIHSAIANAKNTLKVNDDMLQFKLFTIEEGPKLRRYRPGSRGTPNPINKGFSHIKIILVAEQPAVKTNVVEKKKEVSDTELKQEVKKKTKTEETKVKRTVRSSTSKTSVKVPKEEKKK
jgi:large subunit ribosomal protein L22